MIHTLSVVGPLPDDPELPADAPHAASAADATSAAATASVLCITLFTKPSLLDWFSSVPSLLIGALRPAVLANRPGVARDDVAVPGRTGFRHPRLSVVIDVVGTPFRPFFRAYGKAKDKCQSMPNRLFGLRSLPAGAHRSW